MQNPKDQKNLLLLMWLSMIVWGISWSSAKFLSAFGKAENIAWIRFFIVLVSLAFLVKFLKLNFKINSKSFLLIGAGTFCMMSYSIMFFNGLQHGLSGAGGVLVTTMIPLFSYAIGWLLERRPIKKNEYMGLALGLIAFGFLMHLWSPAKGLFEVGNILFLISALLWSLLTKVSSKANNYCHPLVYNFWVHALTVLLMGLFIPIDETLRILKSGDLLFWLNLAFFSVINSAGATTIYLYATTKIGAEKATDYIFLVPVGAVLSSWIFLGERPFWYTLVGGLLGIVAVTILQKKPKNA